MTKRPKVFCIGLNRTGTSSLGALFRSSGLNACHYKDPEGRHLAKRMFSNLSSYRPLLTGLESVDAFCDLTFISYSFYLDAHALFRELHREHPDAYFILNTRPEAAWLASRSSHVGGGGDRFIECYAHALGLSKAEVPEAWTAHWRLHHEAVRTHFQGSGRFLEFDIEADLPEAIRDFLAEDYRIETRHWKRRNEGSARRRRMRWRPERFIMPSLKKRFDL